MQNIEHIFRERKIEYVAFQMTNILGELKSVEVPVSLWGELRRGVGVDGSSLGFQRTEQSDMVAVPDPGTLAIYPWSPNTATFICDMTDNTGAPWPSCPRAILRRNIEQARKLGIEYQMRPELEWHFVDVKLADNRWGVSGADRGNYMDTPPFDAHYELRKAIVGDMVKLGLPVKTIHHECGHSQHEIEFLAHDALHMADFVQRAKVIAKTRAKFAGLTATYMPKPFPAKFGDQPGNGLHIHQYLAEANGRSLVAPNGKQVSDKLRWFIGGVLKRADEITAICNPTTNSYKRLMPGHEAPVYKAWGVGNRTALMRIPGYERSARVEYRASDGACNIYLAAAAILAAGLDGIQNRVEPIPPTTRNIEKLSPKEAKQLGITRLPATLKAALDKLERSGFMRKLLGKELLEVFLRVKRQEWADCLKARRRGPDAEMQWEYSKYLERA
jgi:glutamine synthetase